MKKYKWIMLIVLVPVIGVCIYLNNIKMKPEGFYINLATEIIGIIITVFFVDYILQKNDDKKWEEIDIYVKNKIFILINSFITCYRSNMSIDAEKIYYIMKKQTDDLGAAEYIEFAKNNIINEFDKLIPQFSYKQWIKYSNDSRILYEEINHTVERYKYRLPPSIIHILYSIQECIVTSFTEFNIAPECFSDIKERKDIEKKIKENGVKNAILNSKQIILHLNHLYDVIKLKKPNKCFNPITLFVMVFARRSRKNHANPSLRSGTSVKG